MNRLDPFIPFGILLGFLHVVVNSFVFPPSIQIKSIRLSAGLPNFIRNQIFSHRSSHDDNSIEDLWLLEDEDEDDDDNDDDEEEDQDFLEEEEIDETLSTTPQKPSLVSPRSEQKLSPPVMNSIQTTGTGRNGYNLTTLQNVDYDIKKYFVLNTNISYQIRLELLRDYYREHGDINVPFRYTCQSSDYGQNGKEGSSYAIALGRWLHNLRKTFETDPGKIPEGCISELDGMGMNWEGVGAGRRPSAFRNRCDDLRNFVEANGHDKVPLYGEHRALGQWCERQRVLFRKYLDGGDCGRRLTEKRIKMLKGAGFDIDGLVNTSLDGKFSSRQVSFDKEWDRMFEMLKEYRSKHGDFDFNTDNLDTQNFKLLIYWVAEQKHQHELIRNAFFTGAKNLKSILTPERYQTLTSVGFDFTLDSATPLPWNDVAKFEFDAEEMMGLLEHHCAKTGHCDVSLDEVYTHGNTTEMLKLYTFQQRLRWEHRHEKIRPFTNAKWLLDSEELNLSSRLNKLEFSWYDDSQESTTELFSLQQEYEWWEMYHDFLRYRNANGDSRLECNEAQWYSEELADWLGLQKRIFPVTQRSLSGNDEEDDQNTLTESHYRALRSAGFDKINEDHVFSNLVGRKPSVLTLDHDLEEEVKVLSQDFRQVADVGKRIDKAEQLAWLVRYASLRRYYSKGGSGALSNLSKDDVSGQRLALWANNQRRQYSNFMSGKKSNMSKTRIKMLNKIGFDWNIKKPGAKEEWEEMIQELVKFKEQYGHCFVPAAFPKDARLGQWVSLQRQLYRQKMDEENNALILPSNLSKTKEKELMDIGLDLTMDNLAFGSIAFETTWLCRLEELAAFKDLHGHCDVPIDYNSPYYDLGLWVREQHILYIRGKGGIQSQLDERRIGDLEQIGFTWDAAKTTGDNI